MMTESDFCSDEQRERLILLETVVMHLQTDVEHLNEVILQQQSALKLLKQRLDHWEQHQNSGEDFYEKLDPNERPPHY